MTTFSKLQLSNWRQFSHIDLDLSGQITVLTGQNGCGKTTLLNILSRHFGWNTHLISTPYLSRKKITKIWTDIYDPNRLPDELEDDSLLTPEDEENEEQFDWVDKIVQEQKTIGSIEYSNGIASPINTQTVVSPQYHLNFAKMQAVIGLHIPSHRPASVYTAVQTIPLNAADLAQQYQQFLNLVNHHMMATPNNTKHPNLFMKELLISMMVFGYGNKTVQGNSRYIEFIQEFQEILRTVLPVELGFKRLEVRQPEIVLITNTGTFSMDAMSGGISSLFNIALQIHLYGYDKEFCTVTIDEPENHLHPAMQRRLLPSLAKAFPKYSFIVASHSPSIIASFPQSNVYALVHGNDTKFGVSRKVRSYLVDKNDLSGTPNKILTEILDAGSNLPIWVEKEISNILQDTFMNDSDKAAAVVRKLKELGITDSLPEILSNEKFD